MDKNLLKRFKLYGFGFGVGILILVFFLNGKEASCEWFPNKRILKIIREKKIVFSDELQAQFQAKLVDSVDVINTLKLGSIDFSKSKTKPEPCREYFISTRVKKEKANVLVKICDSTSIIGKFDLEK